MSLLHLYEPLAQFEISFVKHFLGCHEIQKRPDELKDGQPENIITLTDRGIKKKKFNAYGHWWKNLRKWTIINAGYHKNSQILLLNSMTSMTFELMTTKSNQIILTLNTYKCPCLKFIPQMVRNLYLKQTFIDLKNWPNFHYCVGEA